MIPRDYITAWRRQIPWVEDSQVEQDLVICRALVEIFSHSLLRKSLAFRGGTALYKLYVKDITRYSEDIDLVQIKAEPIGPTIDVLRDVLDSWLGKPRWKQGQGRVTLYYRFMSEETPPKQLRLKVEINTREHFSLFGYTFTPFAVSSRWFTGSVEIPTYELDELLGTKMRALFQRKKGRDLFDLATAVANKSVNLTRVVETFSKYLENDGKRVTRAMFEQNLATKLQIPEFSADMQLLLPSNKTWNLEEAAKIVSAKLLTLLPGEPWKANEAV